MRRSSSVGPRDVGNLSREFGMTVRSNHLGIAGKRSPHPSVAERGLAARPQNRSPSLHDQCPRSAAHSTRQTVAEQRRFSEFALSFECVAAQPLHLGIERQRA